MTLPIIRYRTLVELSGIPVEYDQYNLSNSSELTWVEPKEREPLMHNFLHHQRDFKLVSKQRVIPKNSVFEIINWELEPRGTFVIIELVNQRYRVKVSNSELIIKDEGFYEYPQNHSSLVPGNLYRLATPGISVLVASEDQHCCLEQGAVVLFLGLKQWTCTSNYGNDPTRGWKFRVLHKDMEGWIGNINFWPILKELDK